MTYLLLSLSFIYCFLLLCNLIHLFCFVSLFRRLIFVSKLRCEYIYYTFTHYTNSTQLLVYSRYIVNNTIFVSKLRLTCLFQLRNISTLTMLIGTSTLPKATENMPRQKLENERRRLRTQSRIRKHRQRGRNMGETLFIASSNNCSVIMNKQLRITNKRKRHRFDGSNRFQNRTEPTEPVLSVPVPVPVQFSNGTFGSVLGSSKMVEEPN